ncbi:MAG: DUF2793 domain-containing protein [Agarilytica sp.]
MARQSPRTLGFYDFDEDESGWAIEMNETLKLLHLFLGGVTILDRDLDTPPINPVDHDAYIIAPTATGPWTGREGEIAVYFEYLDAWQIFPPWDGLQATIMDETVLSVYIGGSWSSGLAL